MSAVRLALLVSHPGCPSSVVLGDDREADREAGAFGWRYLDWGKRTFCSRSKWQGSLRPSTMPPSVTTFDRQWGRTFGCLLTDPHRMVLSFNCNTTQRHACDADDNRNITRYYKNLLRFFC